MRWFVHGERSIYQSEWVELLLADVELPDGRRYEHHLVKVAASAGVAILDDADRVLMLWRHRFTTDTWSWELPGGAVEAGESPMAAAAREAEEETGWRPSQLLPLAYVQPITGITNAEQHVFRADMATYIGPPSDPYESDRIAWIPLADVPSLIAKRQVVAAATLAGLWQLLADAAEARGRFQGPLTPDQDDTLPA